MRKVIISEQKFRNKITLVSFVCSMFVIWIHTSNLDVYGIDSNSEGIARFTYIIEQLFGKVIVFATPMFFFISGFLFFRNFKPSNIFDKYKSRIKSILIPYIVWNSIYYLFFVILTNVPALSDYANASKYEFSLIAWLSSLWANEYYTLWFLKNLVIYIFISPVLYIILKDWSRVPSGLIVLLVILNLGTVIQDVLIPDGLCMFMAGSYLAINHCYKAQYSSRLLSVWGLLIIILMFITGCRYLNDTTQVLFFIGIWYALDIFDLRQDNDMPYFMKITFFTYVAHDLILETLEKIWLLIMGVSPIFALLDYLCMPFITLSILVTISKIFKRIVPGLWNILNGYRQ